MYSYVEYKIILEFSTFRNSCENVVFLTCIVLHAFQKGIDVVYETIGGQTFDTCLDALV